ncbi:MAG: hypothetical protein AAGE52_32230 [Myxococcota bacterium]
MLLLSRVASAQPTVTVVVTGDPEGEVEAAIAQSDLPIELRVEALPAPQEVAAVETLPELAAAREHYIAAEFEECTAAVGNLDRVLDLVARGESSQAARLLFWRMACAAATGDNGGAGRTAREFAALRLRVPVEIELATPAVERLLGQAIETLSAEPRRRVRFEGPPRAVVSIDGRERCVLPCHLDLPPGTHIARVEGLGLVTETRRVTDDDREVRFAPERAPPDVAAAQWAERYARDPSSAESRESVSLLARALRANNLVFLRAEQLRGELRLRGVASVDEEVVARAEDAGDADDVTEDVLRDLLVEAEVVVLPRKRWKIALAVVGAALLAAAITFAALYERPVDVEVGF